MSPLPPLSVLFVITRADTVGGAQVHVLEMAGRLIEDGHRVLVLTGKSGKFNEGLRAAGIPNRASASLENAPHPYRDWMAYRWLRRQMCDFAPDLVTTHSSKAGLLGRLASFSLRIPALYTVHGWAFTDGVPGLQRHLYRALEALCVPFTRHYICVSNFDRRLAEGIRVPLERLSVIHNGRPDVCLERVVPASEAPLRLVMTARFDRQKDHETLLRAVQGVPGLCVDLVGDGPGLDETRRLAEALGLTSRVTFHGHLSNVESVLARAQIHALISHWEGFPLATLEAMRAGIPTIATDVGGSAEAIEDGQTGFIIPRRDEQALRERLLFLIEHPERRVQMGLAARRRYERAFTFDHMFEETVAVYRRVAQGTA